MPQSHPLTRERHLPAVLALVLLVTLSACFGDGPGGRISGPDGLSFLTTGDGVFHQIPIAAEPADEPGFGHQYQMVWPLGPGQAVLSRGDDWNYRIGVAGASATFLDGLQDLDVVSSQVQLGAWSASPTDYWGAHENGKLFRYNGSWSIHDTGLGSAYDFAALWGFGSNDVWAVGADRSVGGGNNAAIAAHWDGSSWSAVPTPGGAFLLRGVWGASPNDVWAVGYGSTLIHWDGASWTSVAPPLAVDLEFIHGTSANDIWAGGSYGGASGAVMLHYDGTGWTLDNTFVMHDADAGHVYSVQALAPDNVFAAGSGLFRYDGSTWTKVEHPALENAGNDLLFWDMQIGYGRLYAITPGNTGSGLPGVLVTADIAGTQIVNVLVQGSIAPDVAVTVANVTSGEFYVECTDLSGMANFIVPAGNYIVHARNFNICSKADLSVWPNPPGFFQPPSPYFLPGKGSAILLGASSVPLTPVNYKAAVASPLAFAGGTSTLTVDLQPVGATVTCTLLDANGDPFTMAADAFVYGILPFDNTSGLPPLPPGAPTNLPRGIGTAVAPLNAGSSSTCSTSGLPAGNYVLETPPIEVTPGTTQVFREAVTVTSQQASSGGTVVVTFDPEPVRSFTGYLYDPMGDHQGAADLGQLVTYGWGGLPGAPNNQFIVTTDFVRSGTGGPSRFTLELVVGSTTYTLDTTCQKTPPGNGYACSVSGGPPGTVVQGSAEMVNGSTNGSVSWTVDVGGATHVDFRIHSRNGNSKKPADSAPDSGMQGADKTTSGNSFVIMSD